MASRAAEALAPFGGMMVESTPECTLRIDYEGGSRDLKEALAAAYKLLLAETTAPARV